MQHEGEPTFWTWLVPLLFIQSEKYLLREVVFNFVESISNRRLMKNDSVDFNLFNTWLIRESLRATKPVSDLIQSH